MDIKKISRINSGGINREEIYVALTVFAGLTIFIRKESLDLLFRNLLD